MGRHGGLLHRDPLKGRTKKLTAGVRFSLYLSERPGTFDCAECGERKRLRRNCGNRKGYTETILEGVKEWESVPSTRREALKIPWAPTKFMACPLSSITAKTWEILGLINDCTAAETTDILHLPYAGTILDQPPWFREAVRIVRAERASYRSWKMEQRKK